MADAAGNTPVPSEKSPEVNFGVFLVICGILVVLLLLVFCYTRSNRADTENEDGKSKQKSIRRQQKPSQIISCSKHCQYHFMKDVGLERKPGIADTASGLGDTA